MINLVSAAHITWLQLHNVVKIRHLSIKVSAQRLTFVKAEVVFEIDLKWNVVSRFFRHVPLHYFDLNKSAAEARRLISETHGEQAPSVCEHAGNSFNDSKVMISARKTKKRSGQPGRFDVAELQASLDENSAQTLKELLEVLIP